MITHNRSMHPFSFTSIATLTCRHERRADQVTEPLSTIPFLSPLSASPPLCLLFPPFSYPASSFFSVLSLRSSYLIFPSYTCITSCIFSLFSQFFLLPSSISLLHILVSILSLSSSFRFHPHCFVFPFSRSFFVVLFFFCFFYFLFLRIL